MLQNGSGGKNNLFPSRAHNLSSVRPSDGVDYTELS